MAKIKGDPVLTELTCEAQRIEHADSARAALPAGSEYLDSLDLERLTGTAASTWRYWAHIGSGPKSFKLGRRRVWRRSEVLRWLAEQEASA
ncbi:helix-turn-helix transcriptional regulator [Mycobacterium sp. E740]|uniref:helix-turn-helix transcriptional regulator n=1 Tax=Mycobacterium sp. E740 TaxID=1834149 RepID=UPI000AEB4AFB